MPEDITGTELYSGGAIQKPSDKDKGNDVFATLEAFMERVATHSHTGVDSKEITVNFQKEYQDHAETADYTWNAEGNGIFSASLTASAPADIDTANPNMRKYFYKSPTETEWVEFHPEFEKLTSTTFKLFANDTTIDELRVVYF